jgi:hypothetical protein
MGGSALVIAGCLFLAMLVGTALSILWRQPRKPRLEVLSGGAGDAHFAAQAQENEARSRR